MIPNMSNDETEMSAVECVQEMYNMLKEKSFSEEILNNAYQLVKKVQNESKELSNVDDMEKDMPNYANMSKEEMGQDLKKKGIISISIGMEPKKA